MQDSSVNDCSASLLTLQLGSAPHVQICPEDAYKTTWCSSTRASCTGIRLPWRPGLALVHRADAQWFLLISFSYFASAPLRSCNASFAHSSVTLVGSQCAGLEFTPTSARLYGRRGTLAPLGRPWDNWQRTSCYWPSFFFVLSSSLSLWKKMIIFPGFVRAQPWLCHVTSHFDPHRLSCQQHI